MAAARPCRRCREPFIPRGVGRPPVYCGACRAETKPEPAVDEPAWVTALRDAIRGES